MKRLVLGGVSMLLLPYLWSVLASVGYLAIRDQLQFLVFPYLQWWVAAPYWKYNLWMTAYVIGSATVATFVCLLLVIVVVGLCRGGLGRQPGLYGDTGWASRRDMRANGVSTKRSPF